MRPFLFTLVLTAASCAAYAQGVERWSIKTGILFCDDSHVGDKPRGKKDMKAATLWELHPVTAIAFAQAPKIVY